VYVYLKAVFPRLNCFSYMISRFIRQCPGMTVGRVMVRCSSSSVDGVDASAPTVIKVKNRAKSDLRPQTAEEWHSWFQKLPPLDAERELHKLKRTIGALHAKGDYKGALDAAQKLEATVLEEMGGDNAVYASCLNNVALMHKMLGEDEVAVDTYTRALHIYEDVTGRKHASYASTLSNIGILYRGMAEKTSGMDRLQLIERAEEALSDALDTRKEISGGKKQGQHFISYESGNVMESNGCEAG
jgi:hypothetical protein